MILEFNNKLLKMKLPRGIKWFEGEPGRIIFTVCNPNTGGYCTTYICYLLKNKNKEYVYVKPIEFSLLLVSKDAIGPTFDQTFKIIDKIKEFVKEIKLGTARLVSTAGGDLGRERNENRTRL